jgi:hypothetical protein
MQEMLWYCPGCSRRRQAAAAQREELQRTIGNNQNSSSRKDLEIAATTALFQAQLTAISVLGKTNNSIVLAPGVWFVG